MSVLLLDIESTPNVSYVWEHYDQNVIEHLSSWYILCIAWQWLDDKKPSCLSLPEAGGEVEMLTSLARLLDAASVVVAHNGDRFDVRKINARMLYHKMGPPSPYKTVDTLKVARQKFKFNQNGLDPLSQHLGLGKKVKHDGFGLWKRCMASLEDDVAWEKMTRYAKQDIVLLKKLYLELRPWATNHPNLATGHQCPRCMSENLQRRGTVRTVAMQYQQWQCNDCKSWSRSRQAEVDDDRPLLV